MAVTGRSHAWVCGLLDGREIFIRRVERDENLIAYLIDIETRFWEQNVLADVAPDITHISLPALKETFAQGADTISLQSRDFVVSLRERLAAAKAKEKDAKQEKDTVEAEFRLLFGDHSRLVDDETVRGFCNRCDWHSYTSPKVAVDEHRAHVAELIDKHMRERDSATGAEMRRVMNGRGTQRSMTPTRSTGVD